MSLQSGWKLPAKLRIILSIFLHNHVCDEKVEYLAMATDFSALWKRENRVRILIASILYPSGDIIRELLLMLIYGAIW